MKKEETKKIVRQAYSKIAREQGGCGCDSAGCGPDPDQFAKSIGYTDQDLRNIPPEANLGLSCGNPTAIASLKEGEAVLDLGSGAGFDCFLAASQVGTSGKVIGVDMTAEMVEQARENARKNGIKNVEFRLGDIENLPVADDSVDVIISNCVINLSPDKLKTLKEACRVLRPGGRIAISDVALLQELPPKVLESPVAYTGCLAGAVPIQRYKEIVQAAGFRDVRITQRGPGGCGDPTGSNPINQAILKSLPQIESLTGYAVSIYIEGRK